MTKSRRGKLYINDSGWGPEADSIEFGDRVPFGKIHVLIGIIGESSLVSDVISDFVESACHPRPGQNRLDQTHIFVGYMQGIDLSGNSVSGGDMLVYSDDESLFGDTESILPLFD